MKESKAEEQTAAQICKNPKVTSATQTPYGIICLIPQPIDSAIEKRQHFVLSQPKIVRSEQNENIGNKFAPLFKFRNPLPPQSNTLSKRALFQNWYPKFYRNFYKTLFKQLKNLIVPMKGEENKAQAENLPQSSAPDPSKGPQTPQHPQHHPNPHNYGPHPPHTHADHLHPQESQVYNQYHNRYPRPFIPRPDHLLASALIPAASDLHSGYHYPIPFQPYNTDDVGINGPILDENRLANTYDVTPQITLEPETQYSTYLQELQQNQQNNLKDEQNIKVEYVHDYSNIDTNSDDNQNEENNQNEEKQEVVIPIYTNVKVRSPEESQESHSASNTRPVVNSPGPQYTEHFGVFRSPENSRKTNCRKDPFKPIVSESEKPRPQTRRKRYIELDYSKMQLKKVPISFSKNEENPLPEAIVEVKPRSLFRWQQPMIGWRPIVPPEIIRKDVFLKRIGDHMENWDHEQVESQTRFQWDEIEPKIHRAETKPEEVDSKDSHKISSDSVESQRDLRFNNFGHQKNKISKYQQNYENDNRYEAENKIYSQKPSIQSNKQFENQVISAELNRPQLLNQYLPEDIRAVEVENLGDITKVKSLEQIASIPGAIIRPIDPKLTDILLKVLSYNSDFAQKRITNAYFLEFPKMPEYKPKVREENSVKPSANSIGQNSSYVESTEKTVESIVKSLPPNYQLDNEKDVLMNDSDYQYGEALCEGKINGGLADVRKNCRIYYQCTEYTIDTYICPKGTRFDNEKQYCLPSNDVICDKSS